MKANAKTLAPATGRRFTWTPDVPDHRDLTFADIPNISGVATAQKSTVATSQVENQLQLGGCVGNAVTTMTESATGLTTKNAQLSRLMAYRNARSYENSIKTDAGCQGRNAIKAMIKIGVCDETLWPYDVTKFARKPPVKAYTDAERVRLMIAERRLKYYRLSTLDHCLKVLSSGHTFVFGFAVPAAIDNLPKSGVLQLPKAKEASLGGHYVVGKGFDLNKEFILVQNSWDIDWGLKGCFKMPFKWFTDQRRLVDDIWTLA